MYNRLNRVQLLRLLVNFNIRWTKFSNVRRERSILNSKENQLYGMEATFKINFNYVSTSVGSNEAVRHCCIRKVFKSKVL